MGALNEKKALVYFASGMQRDGVDNEAQLRATINAAIRANVAFLSHRCARPGRPPRLWAMPPSPPPAAAACTPAAPAAPPERQFQGQQETLYTLAADTGGKALLDNNDLSMGIQQAQKDISSYYIVGYYSHNEKLDGQFRKVDIKLKPA